MRKPAISFRLFAGSGPLSVYWHEGPYGDAVEARRGSGVGWFAPNGELLGVEFDEVADAADEQTMEFSGGAIVRVLVVKGKVKVQLDTTRRRRKVA